MDWIQEQIKASARKIKGGGGDIGACVLVDIDSSIGFIQGNRQGRDRRSFHALPAYAYAHCLLLDVVYTCMRDRIERSIRGA